MIPARYAYLNDLTLPRTISEAVKLLGVVEKAGASDSPTIMAWAKETGVVGYSHDSIPWCGLFAAVVAQRAGKEAPEGPLWALNWLKFGKPVGQAGLGDVLVYKRPGGGHVNFYVGEDAEAYHGIGGNQSDAVNITRIAKIRCVGIRRPIYNLQPDSVKAYRVGASGLLSTNEA